MDCFILFLIGEASILFESKLYITKMYAFPLSEVMGKQIGRSVEIITFIPSNLLCLLQYDDFGICYHVTFLVAVPI